MLSITYSTREQKKKRVTPSQLMTDYRFWRRFMNLKTPERDTLKSLTICWFIIFSMGNYISSVTTALITLSLTIWLLIFSHITFRELMAVDFLIISLGTDLFLQHWIQRRWASLFVTSSFLRERQTFRYVFLWYFGKLAWVASFQINHP